MTDLYSAVIAGWGATSWLELVSVLAGLAYVILAARENVWCWPAALLGTGTAVVLFWGVSLLMESALNGYYVVMAVYGWWHWRTGGHNGSSLPIKSWQWPQHLGAVAAISILSLISGYFLASNTAAALPYIDSFTTWAAVLTTWMVTQKILQNWLYWVVIDAVSVGLYYERGLSLYALLFVAYTGIAVIGYLQWRKSYASYA